MSGGVRNDLFAIPVRRPVATAMFFLGIVLLGLIAWQRIPVNLLPDVAGEQLFVTFARPGSEPEVIEREILLPLESRASLLEGLDETRATIRGSGGTLTLEFRPGTDLAVRELEMRRLAADLVREQPAGTTINVNNSDISQAVGFAMFIQVTGMDDLNSLMDLVDDQVVPRMAAVDGVSRVSAGGGAPQELTVEIDPDRCAALGIEPGQVVSSLSRSVQRLDYLGGIEGRDRRTAVVLDGRPRGIDTLSRSRVVADRPVELRHVADIEFGTSEMQTLLRVNGEPTVGIVVFQDEDANLIRLGRALRSRLDELREEFAPYNLDFVINFDAAKDLIEKQLDRLKELALTGFVIALVVLFLFLRQWRAVAVVAVAVPTSLLAALALLYVAGLSLNLITLFGLGVVIGALVDNSIVVYEAVQRQLEHGAHADDAAADGIRRTVRAILAASATNAVVFLPLMFADFAAAELRAYLEIMALAILLPMVGSVLVAIGLVPLLARRLAAPAALARVKRVREERQRTGGLKPPDRAGELFIGTLIVALRRPGIWVTGVVTALLITVVFVLPTVAVTSLNQDPPQEDTVRLAVTLDSADSLDRASELFALLEQEVMKLDGIEGVDSTIQEENGQLTVRLPDAEDRPEGLNAATVRAAARRVESQSRGALELDTVQDGFGGGGGLAALTDTSSTEVLISGPETRGLLSLAGELAGRLESIAEIDTARISSRSAQDELRVVADDMAMNAFRLTPDQVLPALNTVRREGVAMQVGFTLPDGREIPLTVRRQAPPRRAIKDLERLRLNTSSGVLPLEAVADVRRMPPPPTITHENGRRQVKVSYTLGREAPTTGNARLSLDRRITDAVGEVYRPAGYTIEVPDPDDSYSWFRSLLIPVLLLLFAVLAITFESMTMPVLVLLSLPLTVLGATWALLLGDVPGLDPMALMGVLALIGLTVNPAILLVDRMQARVRLSGFSAGAAALAAVRERTRPVLMTTATTVAGLWPLALSTGQANELWPPFATVVMGGLVTSTLLTLLVIPVGFVFLHRLDGIFGRLGPWVVIGWAAAVSLTMVPLIRYEIIQSTTWQIMTTLLVGSLFLGLAALIFRRVPLVEPATVGGAPPTLEVRYLNKVYGRPGPIGRAWRVQERFANAVLARGGQPFTPARARERLLPLLLLFLGAGYLAFSVGAIGWRLIFVFGAAALAAGFWRQVRCARGLADERGRVLPGGVIFTPASRACSTARTPLKVGNKLGWILRIRLGKASRSTCVTTRIQPAITTHSTSYCRKVSTIC
ncbi:hypothetical protein BJP37_26720 [Moorena bouillonii PNG]|uniref:Acriflavin resistance protein n=1 Tax=Moorena bouillonii PNG TaxID=568701 RepID=A0A0H4TNU4_9CYAN|nr:hypothetical protein [Moorena bouillonii PNG]OLT62079.1 hypothetical protein BJP37_26720 [Moorena bouillonii PNG]